MARVLAIDDDGAVCATVCAILERAGHQVVTAQDGRRGLKLLEAEQFDLLLIDIFMPEMDGLETIRVLRRSKPKLPIIVMSGAMVEQSQRRRTICRLGRSSAPSKACASRSNRLPWSRPWTAASSATVEIDRRMPMSFGRCPTGLE